MFKTIEREHGRGGPVVGQLDRRDLFLQEAKPIQIPDDHMVVEGPLDGSLELTGPMLYIPKTTAQTDEVTAKFFYLKVADGQYLKVGLQPVK